WHRAYVVRGFSGHWMMFFCASLTILVGAARLRRQSAGAPDPTWVPPTEQGAAPAAPAAVAEQAEAGEGADRPPEPDTARPSWVSLAHADAREDADRPPEPAAALGALVVYLASVALVLSERPALCLAAALPVTIALVLALRRRRGFLNGAWESRFGCLT